MSSADASNIHRFLDEAFAGITMTPETQDLKEEVRANLTARALELQAKGLDSPTAAATAVDELGDIRGLLESLDGGGSTGAASALEALRVYRVRPKPAFVVRTVLLSLGLLADVTFVVLGCLRDLAWVREANAALAAVGGALAIGVIVWDVLRQETSRHHPLPPARAALYGLAAAAALDGLAYGGLFAAYPEHAVYLALGGVLTLASLIGFVWLGTTQTNRTKPWAREVQRRAAVEDRFSQDPVAAARFGIYTVVIWSLTLAAFITVSVTIGVTWSWLTLLIGLSVFMFTLARMLFPARKEDTRHRTDEQPQ